MTHATKRGSITPDCSYDGECYDSGCGYACASVREGDMVSTCEARPEIEASLTNHYCGCVEGFCNWFSQ